MNKTTLLSVCCLLLIANTSFAQVTIGLNEAPIDGALLDLKNLKATSTSAIDATKGLGLPRVILPDLEKLQMGDFVIDNVDNEWEEHIGLMVYNIGMDNVENLCEYTKGGLYVWNGTKWEGIGVEGSDLELQVSTDKYQGANSYILQPTKTIKIPAKRAFEIWRDYTSTDPTLQANKDNGRVLDPAYLALFEGQVLKARIAWEEGMDNAILSGIIEPTIKIEGTGENTIMEITASADKVGNALIQLYKDNGNPATDPVLWQWHIWVTSETPAAEIWKYGNRYVCSRFMDRNLGALTINPAVPATVTSSPSHGLYYQWGRPTPIKSYSRYPWYSSLTTLERASLTAALTTDLFLSQPLERSDWYAYQTSDWKSRWGNMDVKSAFDPCPEGWRVPASLIDHGFSSAWYGLTLENTAWSDEKMGRYMQLDDEANGLNESFYPAAGRLTTSGSRMFVNELGDYWHAASSTKSPPYDSSGGKINFEKNKLSNSFHSRALGLSVRCIQESNVYKQQP